MAPLILLEHIHENLTDIKHYESFGGYGAARLALTSMTPEKITDEVKKSGLRGRGGAGFPAGLKWSFVPKNSTMPRYLCCNADEGEPGTFKDRLLIERNPHQIIEGMIIASFAIGAHLSVIYIRGEFFHGAAVLEQALQDAYAAGYLGKNIFGSGFDLDILLHRGAGAYICGEETALLESIEGHKGQPRLKPPFPAVVGLFQGPTVINNVETLATVPWIISNGGEAYAKLGMPKSSGTRLFCISGHVQKPGVYEVEMGYPLRDFIEQQAGGMLPGMTLKAVIPGGSSTPVLSAEEVSRATLDFESLAGLKSMLGSGAIVVIGEGTCMVHLITRLAKFYAHESCGQCTPCREGVPWLHTILSRIDRGEGRPDDLELISDICGNIMGQTICALGDAAAMPIMSFIQKFRAEFQEHFEHKTCPWVK
jgi:NADH-quinone oxidoreductase subunit F